MKDHLWPKILVVAIFLLGLSGAFFTGVYFGYENRPEVQKVTSLLNKETGKPEEVDFSAFWKAWNIIDERYITDNGNNGTTSTSTTVVTSQDKVWGAIAGMVNSLGDPYSVFLPPDKKKRFEDDISGNFGGVGMEVGIKDNVITVISPLPNSPAKKAGIMPGDKILKIDNTLTADLELDEAIGLIRGEKGKSVSLTLSRSDQKEPIEVKVVRDIITIPTIETKKLESGVFLIKLYNFSAPSPDAFRQALREFIDAKSDKLILDLRGNPGGYLEASVDMASWFLPPGRTVVIERHGDGREDKAYRSKGYDIFNENLKMVVLVDRGSASASEILAGALSEYGKATLIGEKTFGKGSVQELVPVTADSSLKITIAKWFTPKGKSISQNGLEPQIAVPYTEEDFSAGRDPQLKRAEEFLLTGK